MAQDYVALTQAAFEKVDHLFGSDEQAWEYVTEVEGCSMHRFNNAQDIANGIYCVKTEAVFHRTSEEVFNFIWDLGNRKKFDDYGKECKVLEKIEGVEPPIMHSEIMYQSFSMPFPLYHRDFCLIRAYRLLDDHHYTTSAKSVVHPKVPEDPSNHVRGEIIVDGFDVRPDPSNPAHSIVKYVAQVDPKGSIPTFAINLANRKVPQTLSTIRNILHAK